MMADLKKYRGFNGFRLRHHELFTTLPEAARYAARADADGGRNAEEAETEGHLGKDSQRNAAVQAVQAVLEGLEERLNDGQDRR